MPTDNTTTSNKASVDALLVLADTYRLLHMDAEVDLPAAHRIWEQDQFVLRDGAAFYAAVEARLGDMLAEGVVQAAKKTGINVPVVVRMEGTNIEEGRRILAESGLDLDDGLD